jgi:hypothetical protein
MKNTNYEPNSQNSQENDSLPGQTAMLQNLFCLSGPGQGSPPNCGGLQERVRSRWPRPQVEEHRLQGDHSSQTPCTAIRAARVWFIDRKTQTKLRGSDAQPSPCWLFVHGAQRSPQRPLRALYVVRAQTQLGPLYCPSVQYICMCSLCVHGAGIPSGWSATHLSWSASRALLLKHTRDACACYLWMQ